MLDVIKDDHVTIQKVFWCTQMELCIAKHKQSMFDSYFKAIYNK